MDILFDVAVGLTIITASFSIFYMVRGFVQNLVREDKLFEGVIRGVWGWIARNFDTSALCISALLLIIFFFMSKDGTTVHSFIMDETLLVGALLGFPILIKRVRETQLQSRTMQYNAANEMLWSEGLGSRMAGIDALWRVANDYPKEEYHHVMDVFTQFIKNPMPYEWEKETKEQDKKAGKRDDMHKILRYMGAERIAGADFYEIDLSFAHLEGADLCWAYLAEANLNRAYLAEANFWNAHLEKAHLAMADLVFATLNEAHLAEADLYMARAKGAHFARADLAGAKLNSARLEGAYFMRADLEKADLWAAHLEGANLLGANLKGARLGKVRLEVANLNKAHLEESNLEQADLTLAVINGANFTDAKNLTQEQIDECVFITDHNFPDLPTLIASPVVSDALPILPEGMQHNYKQMTRKKWLKARDQFRNLS